MNKGKIIKLISIQYYQTINYMFVKQEENLEMII